jgi:predicted Zn-dependent protease
MISVPSDIDVIGVDILKGVLKVNVSRQEEINIGSESLRDAQKKYKFITSGEKINNLNAIMQKLTSKVQKPQGYSFQIYLIQTDIVNAWTAGGKIFFTTAMYDFCANSDEIACILGHEIAHNLLGHINYRLTKMKMSGQFGEVGQIAGALGMLATTSFGQGDEAHSDLLGIDIAKAAGYRPCTAVSLWERMSEKAGSYDAFSNFLSSHPHPEKRAECITKHISSKYSVKCVE